MSGTSSAWIIPAVTAAAFLAIVPRCAFADSPPKAAAGLKLAQQYCAECHQVAPSSKNGWTDAPAFEAIANRSGTTIATLSATIQQPHMKMLNTERPPAEANEIALYIMTLRKR
jgi:mono/diheme cytochrome c family protein